MSYGHFLTVNKEFCIIANSKNVASETFEVKDEFDVSLQDGNNLDKITLVMKTATSCKKFKTKLIDGTSNINQSKYYSIFNHLSNHFSDYQANSVLDRFGKFQPLLTQY